MNKSLFEDNNSVFLAYIDTKNDKDIKCFNRPKSLNVYLSKQTVNTERLDKAKLQKFKFQKVYN